MACLDEEALLAFVEGRLSEVERRLVDAHVDDCEVCRAGLLEAAQGDVDEEQTADLRGREKRVVIDDRFELLAAAASGGMGVVHRARDRESGDVVAIKFMGTRAGVELSRFEREAATLAALSHPRIVRYVAHGIAEGGRPYLAMEWIEGVVLRDALKAARLRIEDAIDLGLALCDALIASHAAGIVHRDLKPSNIVLVSGEPWRPKIIDFGIARGVSASEPLTAPGATLGTPAYMAPEQARDAAMVDGRADLFSLGCILYRAVTGAHPFEGHGQVAAIAKILLEPPTPIERHRVDVPLGLRALIHQMLEKNPARRPQSAAEVQAELARVREDSNGARRPTAPPPSTTGSTPSFADARRRVICVLLIRPGEAGRENLSGVIEAFGGRFEALKRGEVVVTLARISHAQDQTLRAARLSLAIRARSPDATIALALGSGSVAGNEVWGQVIDRGADQLRLAGPGEIRLDPSTASALEGGFAIARDPQGALLIREEDLADASRLVCGVATTTVGREPELGLLLASTREAFEERAPRVLVVTGAPGSGKTRLRQELVGRLRAAVPDVDVLLGIADPIRENTGYALVADVLRRALGPGSRDELVARLEDLLGASPGSAATRAAKRLVQLLSLCEPSFGEEKPTMPHASSDGFQLAWEDFVAASARRGPTLLVLDDVQYADAASIRLTEAALRNLKDVPFVVLALARPESIAQLFAGKVAQEVRLGPLSARAAELLANQVIARLRRAGSWGERADEGDAATIAQRSEGSPFFIEELLRGYSETKSHVVPDTVLGAIQARLDRLGEDERRVLCAATIFGSTFWRGGVAALLPGLGQPALDRSFATLERSEVLVARRESRIEGEQELGFVSELIHQAVSATIGDDDWAPAHRAAATWLRARGAPDDAAIAAHYEHAGEHAEARAAHLAAARRALMSNDSTQVRRHVESGLALGAEGEERAQLLLSLCELHLFGDQVEAQRVSQEIMDLAPLGSTPYLHALGMNASAAAGLGQSAEVIRLAERWSIETPSPLTAAAALAGVRVSLNLFMLGETANFARIMGALRGAPAVIEHAAIHARFLWVDGLRWLGERPYAFLRTVELCTERFEEAGDVRNAINARISAGYTLVMLGDPERALGLLTDAAAVAERLGNRHLSATAHHNLGLCQERLGDLASARDNERFALDTFEALSEHRMIGSSRVYLAAIERALGEDSLATAEQAERDLASSLHRPQATLEIALAHRARGDHATAFTHARRALHDLRTLRKSREGDVSVMGALASLLHEVGRAQASRRVARQALRIVEQRAGSIEDLALRERFLAMRDHEALRGWAGSR